MSSLGCQDLDLSMKILLVVNKKEKKKTRLNSNWLKDEKAANALVLIIEKFRGRAWFQEWLHPKFSWLSSGGDFSPFWFCFMSLCYPLTAPSTPSWSQKDCHGPTLHFGVKQNGKERRLFPSHANKMLGIVSNELTWAKQSGLGAG